MKDDLNPGPPHHPEDDALAMAMQELIEQHALSAEATPLETSEIAGLACASGEWQSELAERLARTSAGASMANDMLKVVPLRQGQKKANPIYLWTGSALAAAFLLAAVLLGWWRLGNSPERLLAEAYTHSRLFDLRMPGAGFAGVTPQVHLRGSGTGRESAELLDARSRIERHLEKTPTDPHWLQLEARADILEEKFDPAIDILDRLIAAGPVTSGLLVDDAAAYFQRGAATGSENDRATALEYLRRADELAPDDTLVLFNEAVVMEDRGQLMNAVETWNRYLQFERDPLWQAEGRRRMEALEEKLKRMKSHQSRMDQHLATPTAMRSLAADPAALSAIDEELSSTMLPQLLNAAFPMPVDRSRGSPGDLDCPDACQSARTLLHALAASLEQTHHDSWLARLLPSDSSPHELSFVEAAHLLSQAIGADVEGDYPTARQRAPHAARLFHALGNRAGEDRAQLELSYAEQRGSNHARCYAAVHPLLGRDPEFAWIQIFSLTQDTLCDPAPGTAGENNPLFLRAIDSAHASGYTLLELRARNLLGSPAVDSGDTEAAWRVYLPTVQRFYSGDYPPFRLYAVLSGLAQVEQGTPRVQNALLIQREVVHVLEMTGSRQLIPTERLNLAAAALRAGAVAEAENEMRQAKAELAQNGGGAAVKGLLAENEIAMANLYLDRDDFNAAAGMLNSAQGHMGGENNAYHRRDYAEASGRLNLAQGHPEIAEPLLRNAILDEERLAGKAGEDSIVLAQQDRELYAVLAGVWLAQGRPGQEVLALWERYRLRILGNLPPVCQEKRLDCLLPRISKAIAQLGPDQLIGQIVLENRLLLYKVTVMGVTFTLMPVRKEDALADALILEKAVSSPASSMDSVDSNARRVGMQLVDPLLNSSPSALPIAQLFIESDPLLANLPWPSVENASGSLGLQFSLEELPSLALDRRGDHNARSNISAAARPSGKALIVGASIASSRTPDIQLLPEVLSEAHAVARFEDDPNVLLANQATEQQVAARLATATAVHFAGHATQEDGETRLLLASVKGSPVSDRPWLDSELLRRHPPSSALLTVFSACSTGKKEEGWNHGMGDIVAALASVGVPDVVATRWQIDSASAVPMMDRFYAGLAQGLSVPEALRAARKSLIGDPRYRHPYYWAAWYASGWGRSNLSQVFHGS